MRSRRRARGNKDVGQLNAIASGERRKFAGSSHSSGSEKEKSLCDGCALRNLPFCSAAMAETPGATDRPRPRHMTARRRQALYRKNQRSEDVILIREGWAFRFAVSANGRRHIQAILLPGDLLAAPSLFKDKLGSSVQTLTPLGYCAFDRAKLWRAIEANPKSMHRIVSLCVEEHERNDEHMVDLVTRTAEERIVLLVLDLFGRLGRLGLVEDQSFAFPLTQQHLADAVGLTQVHVNRVLRRLKECDFLGISHGRMHIKDLAGLRDIAMAR